MISTQVRYILEELREAAIGRTASGRIVYWNPAAVRLYGYGVEEALEMSVEVLVPDSRKPELQQKTRQVLTGQPTSRFLTVRKHRSGAKSQVVLQLIPLLRGGQVEGILELSRGKRGSAKGARYRQLAQTVAHELRSPLSSLRNIAYLLDASEMQRHARIMKRQILHCENIVENLLIWTGVKVKRSKEIALREIIQEIVEMEVIPENIKLDTTGVGDVYLSADGVEMRQVILNLISNSVDALGKSSGTITLAAGAAEAVKIEISDDGPGIAPEIVARIFEPLVTTKKSGMGLGLSIAKRLVEENGGQIHVESQAGGGTKFKVSLPGYPRTKLL